jgi:Flp pilus assembly protein TadG
MRLFAHRLFGRRTKRRTGFLADQRGALAIEFAILALPFFALVGAIIETAEVFLGSQLLDSAVQDASRLVRTGQAQGNSPPYTISDFRNAVCDHLFGLFNCDNLEIKVSTVTDFADATASVPATPADLAAWTGYEPGTGSSIVMVQVYYKWPVILNFGGFSLATSSDGTHLMGAVRVFENEPFS